ncbi:Scaffold protein Nfu/NifU N terminal [Sphingomonas paucimobilis]|nr:Scaffold protein Nfu/NifU N terminal [Sphingomonas paucimobilis]
MGPMLIETEPTPNPATLKFLPGRKVMDSGTRDFASPEEAAASPLAEAIFNLGDVTACSSAATSCRSRSRRVSTGRM